MRRGRRGGHSVLEFGGSGEDSFVAVVVTKLTGALLFILLLVMVIMALLPKAVDTPSPSPGGAPPEEPGGPLMIATPERLPEAIAGRPYELALAASGGSGPLRWSIDGPMPEGLRFEAETGLIVGTPTGRSSGTRALTVRVSDGRQSDAKRVALVVYRPETTLTIPSPDDLALPRVTWRAWIEQGFGFVVLLLVHMVAMNGVAAMQRRAEALADRGDGRDENPANRPPRRFAFYRLGLRLTTLSAVSALAVWLWLHRLEPTVAEPEPESRSTPTPTVATDPSNATDADRTETR